MTITVIVRSGDLAKKASAITFDGERVVMGRGDGSDVRLPDPSVSHRHASLRWSGGAWNLVDEGSTNGTYSGGVALLPRTPRAVRSGDKIRLGRVWLELSMEPAPPTMDLGAATRDVALALVASALSKIDGDTTPSVRVVEGHDAGKELRLDTDGRVLSVGRGIQCELLLDDPDVSREHVTIMRRGSTVMVRDLGSHNGVLLGEQTLAPQRDVVWRSPTLLRLGRTVLALDEPVARALAELEREPDVELSAGDQTEAAAELAHEEVVVGAPAPEDAPKSLTPKTLATKQASKRSWTVTDVFVLLASVFVIAASAAALFWVLRS